MRRPRTEKQAMLDALRASCGPDGAPNISAVARQFSADRKAVRELWNARDKLAVLPPPERHTPAKGETVADPLGMSPAEFARWQFGQVLEDLDVARRDRGGHGVGKLHELLTQTAATFRAEHAKEQQRRPTTAAEREQRARNLAQQLGPREAVVILEELRKRHIA